MEINGMDISPELMEKVKACTSPEELLELAHEEGRELSEGELEGIVGGWGGGPTDTCPKRTGGDAREDIDPARAHSDFVNGIIDGGELD